MEWGKGFGRRGWFAALLGAVGLAVVLWKGFAAGEAEPGGEWRSVNGGMAAMLATPNGTPAPTGPADGAAGAGTARRSVASPSVERASPGSPAAAASAGPANPTPSSAGNPASEAIDINTAGVERLTALPGIGPSKAKAIAEYRQTHGPFRVPEDLMKVKGIGPKTYDRLKERIRVSP